MLEDDKLDLAAEVAKLKEQMEAQRQELMDKLADMQKSINRSKADREVQTELNLDNFDPTAAPLHKAESKASGQSQKVGGGGVISRPPRGPSEKRLTGKVSGEMSVAGVGQKGDQASAKNESNSSRKLSQQNTARQPGDSKKSLPNLLKNSQSQHYRSQKSTQSGGPKAKQDGGQPIAEKSQSSNKEAAAEGGPEEGVEKANTLSSERNRRSQIANEVIQEEEVENE